jgi:hypothetical protein
MKIHRIHIIIIVTVLLCNCAGEAKRHKSDNIENAVSVLYFAQDYILDTVSVQNGDSVLFSGVVTTNWSIGVAYGINIPSSAKKLTISVNQLPVKEVQVKPGYPAIFIFKDSTSLSVDYSSTVPVLD